MCSSELASVCSIPRAATAAVAVASLHRRAPRERCGPSAMNRAEPSSLKEARCSRGLWDTAGRVPEAAPGTQQTCCPFRQRASSEDGVSEWPSPRREAANIRVLGTAATRGALGRVCSSSVRPSHAVQAHSRETITTLSPSSSASSISVASSAESKSSQLLSATSSSEAIGIGGASMLGGSAHRSVHARSCAARDILAGKRSLWWSDLRSCRGPSMLPRRFSDAKASPSLWGWNRPPGVQGACQRLGHHVTNDPDEIAWQRCERGRPKRSPMVAWTGVRRAPPTRRGSIHSVLRACLRSSARRLVKYRQHDGTSLHFARHYARVPRRVFQSWRVGERQSNLHAGVRLVPRNACARRYGDALVKAGSRLVHGTGSGNQQRATPGRFFLICDQRDEAWVVAEYHRSSARA